MNVKFLCPMCKTITDGLSYDASSVRTKIRCTVCNKEFDSVCRIGEPFGEMKLEGTYLYVPENISDYFSTL